MSIARSLVSICLLLTAVCTTFALAQQPITTIERPAFGVRFDVPAAWVGEAAIGEGGEETMTFEAPDDAGAVVVVLGRLSAADREQFAGVGPEAVWDAWEGFSSGMQGVRVEREGARTVAGVTAGVLDYVGDGISGSLIGAISDGLGITIVSIGVDGRADEVRAGLETILVSFATRSAGEAAAGGAGNPLAPPTRSAAAGNPLAPAPTNPEAMAPVSQAGYLEPFTGTDPRSTFGGVLDVGSDGTWTGALTGTAYRLTNDASPDAVRYYYLMDVPGEAGPLAQGTIGVTIGLAPGSGGLTAAGLLFDFDPNDGTYLAFALTTTGYVVLQRSADGLELLVDEDLDTLRPDGRNRLELRAVGTSVEVVVNGAPAATLNGGQPFAGGVGLVAVGAGAFEYQDFRYQRP